MSLQLNTPPAQEPVTLAQAKAWLRVESGTDEDDLIAALIAAARARAEWHTGRAFVTQGWTLWLDRAAPVIGIPLPPLQAAWAALPDDLKQHVPAGIVTAVSIALLLLGIGGRLVRQRRH
jgi:hypothetical protein